MRRMTLIAALASLCFLATAPSDTDAGCGGGSGRGLFRGRIFNRTARTSASFRTTSRASYSSTYSAAPVVVVPSKATGGCVPGCPCPNAVPQLPPPTPMTEQKAAYSYPQTFRTVTVRARSSGGCANGGCAVAR